MTTPAVFSHVEEPAKLTREQARAAGRKKAAAKKSAAKKAVAPVRADQPPPSPVEAATGRPDRRAGRGDQIDGMSELRRVPVDDIKLDPDNPRTIVRNVGELAASMKAVGLEQPISTRIDAQGNLILRFGQRRLAAAKLLNWTHIDTVIRYGAPDTDLLIRQLTENTMREPMDPIDEARAVRAIMRKHKLATYMECAQEIGHSLSWVANRVSLLDLDEEDQVAVSSGELKIMAAVAKSRQKTGNTRVSAKQRSVATPKPQYFGDSHPLASRARGRCRAKLDKSVDHRTLIGGVACGHCWETVIRLDASRTGITVPE